MKLKFLSFFYILLISTIILCEQKIAIIGSGYVGLTMAAVLSKSGYEIICMDIDQEKVSQLQNNKVHIYEPHLEDFLFNNPESKNITFTDTLDDTVDAEIFYICVPTPIYENGHCDCSFLKVAFQSVVEHCRENIPRIIVVKSTVPPGTVSRLKKNIPDNKKEYIKVVYNPEFLREGSAIKDIYTTNPIILGGESEEALSTIEHLYDNLINEHVKVIRSNYETAEIIKYAWNSFSAIRIAYINELALLCRQYGANILEVVPGFALSEVLLPTERIVPGPGFGGSCLPKDTSEFSRLLEEKGFTSSMIHQAIQSNKDHKMRVIQDIYTLLGDIEVEKKVAILGLSFKANTNDIRNAPSIDIIEALLTSGVTVRAYDPKAIPEMKKIFPQVYYFNSPYEAIKDCDCIVILTEWEQIKQIDLAKAAQLCHKKNIVDARNLYDVRLLKKFGFNYINMGAL